MSSNIRLEKLCQQCGEKFTAKTLVTQYCGERCAKRAYKKRMRDKKVRLAPLEAQLSKLVGPDKIRIGKKKRLTVDPNALIKDRDFFSITQTSALLGVSERTLFRMINRKQIDSIKIGGRTLIKKSELLPYYS